MSRILFSTCLSALIAVILGTGPAALAQTTTAGKVTGTVTDASGAVVPKAEVQLVNVDTGTVLSTVSDGTGGFLFPVVNAGKYRLSVKATGFRAALVQDITVDAEKTSTWPVKLEVGGDTEVVEVRATAVAQLQTTDAQIGNTLETDNILRLPALQRNAIELVSLQPGVVTGGAGLTMRVSGAIDDQNTVTVDGIDITQNVIATGTSIPTPDDSVEEFRVNVANPSATLMRASGAQVTLIGRRGNNDLHGALYEYVQNNDFNANTWDNNRAHLPKAIIHDNRLGARAGGPIKKNKTFIFGNYEARRFDSVAQVTRTVPTALLRQGIIQFQGPGGVEQFNVKTAAICNAPSGSVGTTACDPRGLGVSPSVAAQFADMPLPNLAGGDGLNTGSFFANLPTPVSTDYGVIRLDHMFNEKLTLNATFTYFRSDQVASGDISILDGNATSAETTPQRGIVPSLQATWQISPTLVNVARIGWVRDTSQTNATSPTKAAGILNIPGSQTSDGPIALTIGSGVSSFIDSPIDMDTQRARFQAAWSQDGQIYDDVTKVWGKHNLQFGAQFNKIDFTHARADKVLGSITSLVAQIDGDQTYLTIPTVNEPAVCGGSIASSCVPSSQLGNWDRYYASLLGLVDNVGVLAVRNQNLQPQPLGTFLRDVTNQYATYFYAQDSFRIKPSLTLYYGLSYGWQTPPTEQHNLQTIMIDSADGSLVTESFLQQKMQAALKGQIDNPTFGFETVSTAHRPVYDTDWGDVAPRLALAWNPSAPSGVWQSILGQNKTVIRGGFGMVYDRSNTVQSVEIPMLGIGFDQNIFVATPACNATGPGGAGCNPAGGVAANPGLASFRVGTDGTLPLPTATAATSPIIPGVGQETLSFQVDPNTKIGRSYNFDFSLQRELPGQVVMEVAYIGREARDLPQAVNVNSAPYMFVDSASQQSFAQAYDLIADALRAGQAAPVEPFFENQFPGLAALKHTASATAYIVSANKSLFTAGSVGNLFLNLDSYRRLIGLPAYDSDQAQVEFLRTYIGYSNYNAGAITFTKRMSRGFSISGNYTYAKALDDGLSNQNNAGFFSNSFDPGVQYGPSAYDRRHVVNAYYEYDAPLGKGHLLDGGKAFNWLLGGWYTSGIFSAWTGLPVKVTEGSQVWGGGTSVIGGTDYAVPVGPLPGTGLNHNVANTTSCSTSFFNGTVGANVGGASGTNMDLFSNPGAAFCDFNYVQLSSDGRTGSANPMYGLPFWNLDMRLAKNTKISERFNTVLSADFFNVFNHENFNNPSLSLSSPATFGVITSTFTPANRTNSARWIEMSLRLEF
ncbi:MAG TPA: carboxypeptidase-like regulatory domain-containing protein [Bryobacteraceae bacterium]|nr:carboxypeptidase-like regulatory domain-containing protein [Bryobacteraceae bacterium]